MRLGSKPGRKIHWLAGRYWKRPSTRTPAEVLHAGRRGQQPHVSLLELIIHTAPGYFVAPNRVRVQTRTDIADHEFTNISFDITDKLTSKRESCVHSNSREQPLASSYTNRRLLLNGGSRTRGTQRTAQLQKIRTMMLVVRRRRARFREAAPTRDIPRGCTPMECRRSYRAGHAQQLTKLA